MDFQDFLNIIPKIAKEKLLGMDSHLKMASLERIDIMRKGLLNYKDKREAAVMMLFYPKDTETYFVLIIRNEYPGIHSSQISFPGGKVEEDDISLEYTALRETYEEIGITPDKINIVKPFSDIYIPPSNFIVHPFMGYSNEEIVFSLSSREVAGIIEWPLSDFLEDKNIVNVAMKTSYANNTVVPAFKIEEHIVWGATAMILNELKETIKNIL